MKKYTEVLNESVLPRHSFVFKVASLREFLIYKSGMFDVINKLLRENSTPKNLLL